ncbi:hypothetical protein Q6280_27740, partial [Klebsiella pneumoniae]|uniref:hypothetical protein n=1 Tax=Klebsiella pneumoniae TaxID=573 RepID=UPI0027306109
IVAASAIAGYIDMPDFDDVATIRGSGKVFEEPSVTGDKIKIIKGFKEKVTGELIFCHKDNLNTDGIYPGKYTYLDEFTHQQQAEVV